MGRDYIDAPAAIRNCVVHGSDASVIAYKRHLRQVYNIHSAPEPDEFLGSIDNRTNSPGRYERRLNGLANVLKDAIQASTRSGAFDHPAAVECQFTNLGDDAAPSAGDGRCCHLESKQLA